MTTIAEVMTRDAEVLTPEASLQEAAQAMDRLNVGALPVCDGTRLVGMLTDRDIVVRGVSAGAAPEASVLETLSDTVEWCYEDEDVSVAEHKMAERQIRRLPVVDRNKKLVGIVSLGDLATYGDGGLSSTLGAVSSPSQPDRGR
ncbi:CBS domain-containing protein [Paraburkholderia tagetis]|uniref:CBS domain-containing protein n=1 Tax=Paraburkholderia tagetis TaxID=2913261 RepID=A0A9X1RSE4_9BURK|nr:CBS domain-containing protein [Paraburkholderia tagetis]MCG5075126.1 CBS domain-containing protein [Paraburkholderia tagetis]